MKITDTTDFFLSLSAVGSVFPSFVCISSFIIFKKKENFVRCFAIIICLTWCCRCFFFVISLIVFAGVYVCVMCMENKSISSFESEKRERERESLHLGISLECTGTSTHRKHFKCKALNFQVYFAPFVWKVVKQIFIFFSLLPFWRFSTYEFDSLSQFVFFLHSKNKNGFHTKKKTSTCQWYVIIMHRYSCRLFE